MNRFMTDDAVGNRIPPLDGEELRLLGLLAQGVSGARLARELGYSSATTRRRLHAVRAKTGASTTVHAVVVAVRAGLV